MRFPEFEDEWNSMQLGSVMEFKVTNSLSREKLNYTGGLVKNIHYGDIHTKFQTLFDVEQEEAPYINSDVQLNKIPDDCYCKVGDIVFADASEDLNDVGKTIEIINIGKVKLLSGLHTLLARPKSDVFHTGFAGYLFNSICIRTQIQKEAQGAKVLGISVGRISKINLSYPSLNEQRKIATLLIAIDRRIQTQNKIIAQLESLMHGCSEMLFKQLIRFKDEHGSAFPSWQAKKLGDIAMKRTSNISANSLNDNEGEYKIYGAMGVLKNIDFYREQEEYISVVKDGAGVGRLLLCEAKSSVLGTLDIVKNNKFSSLKFLYYILRTVDFSKYITGSTIPHIYFKDYANEIINIPCLREQTLIENFLTSIDKKIKTEKEILDQYQKQKKHLLANLFI